MNYYKYQKIIIFLLIHCLNLIVALQALPAALPQQASSITSTSHQDTPTGECNAKHPCQNNGVCVEGNNSYTCECPEGFTGPYCGQDINECARKPSVCENGATCINKVGGYQCVCVNGWTGPDCSENVDDCATATCQSGAKCIDRVGHFVCECPPGKTGLLCQLDDGCFTNPCHPNATCDTNPINGHAICTCPPGFTGSDCSIDIDECAAGSPCEHEGICVNIPGSFKCECPKGFAGSRCEVNINECESNPCMNEATCLDEKGGYRCVCPNGFTGQRCEINIDECEKNPCQNGATCKDYVNAFRCICPMGFWGERCEFSVNNTITPEIGPNLYPCPVGWEGINCSEDIDECAIKNRCKNGGVCINHPGAYRCECPDNFTGPHCERLKTACENKPCMNNANCVDLPVDGKYSCECSEGFFGQHCEKESCMHKGCKNNGSCMKVMNKYLCSCPPGFSGQLCEKQFTTPLSETSYKPIQMVSSCSKCKNNARCITDEDSNGAICQCRKGFSGPDCSIRNFGDNEDDYAQSNTKPITKCDGDDCSLLGDMYPWAKCQKPIKCIRAFQNGRCDQECNTAECLYDGDDCTPIAPRSISTSTPTRSCNPDKGDYCLKRYANGQCDPECNSQECGWDGADCESSITNEQGLVPVNTEASGLLVIRVEPAIEIGSGNSPNDIVLARMLRTVSVLTKTILKIQNFRQVEEGRGTEMELIADNRKCSSSCYNSTELIAKFLSALNSRDKLDSGGPSKLVHITSVPSPSDDDQGQHQSFTNLYVITFGLVASVCTVLMVISVGSKQKVKEKAVVWFPEGFKPVLSTRNKDPTNRKPGRGVSTLQALGGNFFRGIKRNERNISTDPNGVHSTNIDRCGTATPNGGGIYHEPYEQYDQYGTYNGTETCSVVNGVEDPMTPTPMPSDPVNMIGPNGLTPLMMASMGPPPSKEPLGLVAYGTLGEMPDKTVTDLLQQGARLNAVFSDTGETPLHLAARFSRVDAARGILERCDADDINAKDNSGRTPLHTAIAAHSLGVFELLIKCRVTDLNAQANDGTTPLILATRHGHYSMLEELILSECEVAKSDDNGKTALHWAAATNNVDAINRLLKIRETNKDAQDLAEETPLFLAAREGAKGAVEALLAHNANKDICDQMGVSPAEIAESRKHYDIVKLLDEHSPQTPMNNNKTSQTFWTNNNNPNMVNVNNIVIDKKHGLTEVYNTPCLKNFMTPLPDSPFSLESMSSPPGTTYPDQQYQNSDHISLANHDQAGVFI